MQTTKSKKQVALPLTKDWQAMDYLRASLCLPFIALGISSLHPLLPPMIISSAVLGLIAVITNVSAGIEYDCGSIRSDSLGIAKKIPLVGLPLLGIAVIGFLIGSMFWMGLGLSLLILFGFPAVGVFASFGYLAWSSTAPPSHNHAFTMFSCFHYSAMIGFFIAALGGVVRLVPVAIQVQ